jgi:Ca-activated chloride channel family protein
MSKESNSLEDMFARQSDVKPREEAKAEAISAAISAFEDKKNSETSQDVADEKRPTKQRNRKPVPFNWRDFMNSIVTKQNLSLAGGASVAVLGLMLMGPNIADLLRDLPSGVSSSAPESVEPAKTELEAVQERQAKPVLQEEADNSQVAQDLAVSPEPSVRRESAPLGQLSAPVTNSYKQSGEGASAHGQVRSFATKKLRTSGNVKVSPSPIDSIALQYSDQGRDKFEEIKTNPVKVTKEDPVSTISADVDTASYSFMRSSLNNNVLPQADAVRVEELINYFDYQYEVPADKSEPFNANIEIMPTPWNEGTKLLSIGIKGYEVERAEVPDSNLVFLIDTSGSMNAENKLPLLRNAFKLLLSNLKPTDTVSIVTYAGSAGTALEPTKASEKGKILAALDRLNAGGSTAGAEGIRQAYGLAEANFKDNGINRVILATDGDFNVGIANPDELKSYIERKRDTGVSLSVLGFGRGNYNDQLMQTLAQNGNGNASYIDTLSEARKVLVEEAGSTLFPIANDVKLQVEFNPSLVSEYRLIGYETRALKREDFNNDKVDAGDIGAGHTVTALYEITPVGSDAKLVDGLRYGEEQAENTNASSLNEYGFLKMRYKLPGSDTSKLITRALTAGDEVSSADAASDDTRFAASVAAFGQLLRGGQYTGSYGHDDIIELAQSGKGDDQFGYRSEFINLVRLAKSASALEPLKQ